MEYASVNVKRLHKTLGCIVYVELIFKLLSTQRKMKVSRQGCQRRGSSRNCFVPPTGMDGWSVSPSPVLPHSRGVPWQGVCRQAAAIIKAGSTSILGHRIIFGTLKRGLARSYMHFRLHNREALWLGCGYFAARLPFPRPLIGSEGI